MDPSSTSPDQLQIEKRTLRNDMAERRQRLVVAEAQRLSGLASARLDDVPAFAGAAAGATIAGFVALTGKGEADPALALAAARTRGAVVVYPRINLIGATPPRLRFHRADSAGDLVPGPFGLRQPAPTCPELPLERIDVMLTPGLAFDLDGRRLGFGGGYYDEVAARLRGGAGAGAVLIGFGYEFQIVPRCPAGGGDVAIHWVVTDQRATPCGAAP